MATYPDDVLYNEQHQWLRARDKFVTVGITQVAADKAGELTYIELPYAGELFQTGALIGRVGAALRMPFTGHVTEINERAKDAPSVINEDPYGAGWLIRIEPGDAAYAESLMSAEQYAAFVASGDD